VKETSRMRYGPAVTWIHALHQVTGALALSRIHGDDRELIKRVLRKVLEEMDDEENWKKFPGRPG